MDESAIARIMFNDSYTKDVFEGTFPIDIFVKHKIYIKPAAYVINTGPSNTSGEHWLGVYINEDCIYYMDSLGVHPEHRPNIKRFFASVNGKIKVVYNMRRMQSLNSNVCGFYVVHFIIWMARGFHFDHFVNLFSKTNFKNNDLYVCDFVKKQFPFTSTPCII